MGVIFRNGIPYAGSMTIPMSGATSQSDGAAGLVPIPTSSDVNKYLKGDGTWGSVSGNTPESVITTFNADGSITETSDSKVVTTEFNSDGSITETYQYKENNVVVKTLEKTTVFNSDGSISETVQEVED